MADLSRPSRRWPGSARGVVPGGVVAGGAGGSAPVSRDHRAAPGEATILVSRLHAPVTTLGPGVRAGIWTQGCTLHCPGCVSVDTWSFSANAAVPIGEVSAWLAALPDTVTGVTISGGEPFDQPEPLLELLRAIAEWCERRAPTDVLCYSGRTYDQVSARFTEHLALLDAIITGPYRADAGPGGAWIGSANQRLDLLTDLGRQRFAGHAQADGVPAVGMSAQTDGVMQVDVDDHGLWMVGVPAHDGDMARLRTLLAERGIRLRHPSWAPSHPPSEAPHD